MVDSMTKPPAEATRSGLARRFARFVARAAAVIAMAWLAGAALHRPAIEAASAQPTCPPSCANQTLTAQNFSHADLTGADFTGATLVGPNFIRATLTGANFTNATFVSVPGNPTQMPDFTFANLTNAKFVNAKFDAPTYFTYAMLTCADFSHTNLNNGNAVFGDESLLFDANAPCPGAICPSPGCRVKFEFATMNCEFIDQWAAFDLSSANISACFDKLAGRNFANAVMPDVNFAGMILDGTNFNTANVSQAVFDNASLQCATLQNGNSQCVDFSHAQLQGASLNNANLSGASLFSAFLSNNVNGEITQAAQLKQAHLRNVNLAYSQLSGVVFTLANFYSVGGNPANPGGCATTGGSDLSGFTIFCSSAFHANMTGTQFGDAYLYGVDFRDASIAGVNFTDAVLAGANFKGATIGADPNSGAVTEFLRAYLQGTNLDQATVSLADLTDAFVDFGSGGNLLSIELDGADHNQFACSTPSTCNPASGEDVCVYVRFPKTTVPTANTTITCPHGLPAGPGGCGIADPGGGNTRWQSKLTIDSPPNPGPPPGWYTNPATYTPKAPPGSVCNGAGPTARVLAW